MTTTTAPKWAPVDDPTHDLLMLVAEDHVTITPVEEWDIFKQALKAAADDDMIVRPNTLRPLLRGRIAPRRIGAFTTRALTRSEDLLVPTGEWQISDDTEGHNAGRPMRVYRLTG